MATGPTATSKKVQKATVIQTGTEKKHKDFYKHGDQITKSWKYEVKIGGVKFATSIKSGSLQALEDCLNSRKGFKILNMSLKT